MIARDFPLLICSFLWNFFINKIEGIEYKIYSNILEISQQTEINLANRYSIGHYTTYAT